MKFICSATHYTSPPVSVPDRKLNRCGYHSAPLNVRRHCTTNAIFCFHGNESVFKYVAVFIAFPPRIDQMKDPVIRPNPWLDLFVNSHSLWRALPTFILLSSLVEFTVLRETTGRKSLWLIHDFWIWIRRP